MNKKTTLLMAVAMASAFTAGCSIAPAIADSVESLLSGTVNEYCKADEIGRTLIRQRFGKMTYPHIIRVECAGDVLAPGG